MKLPAVALQVTDGATSAPAELPSRTVIFVFPTMAIEGPELQRWTAIPGARGCTREACNFRDQLDRFRSLDVEVLGLSGQPPAEQVEAVDRLMLPYLMLSDEKRRFGQVLGLPTFEFDRRTYLKRLTLIVERGEIEAALYPVFPPDQAAEQAQAWLNTWARERAFRATTRAISSGTHPDRRGAGSRSGWRARSRGADVRPVFMNEPPPG